MWNNVRLKIKSVNFLEITFLFVMFAFTSLSKVQLQIFFSGQSSLLFILIFLKSCDIHEACFLYFCHRFQCLSWLLSWPDFFHNFKRYVPITEEFDNILFLFWCSFLQLIWKFYKLKKNNPPTKKKTNYFPLHFCNEKLL